MTGAGSQAAELRAAGEPDRALRLIERVLELQPGHPRARFAAGQLHAGRGRWAAAEQEYVAAAQLEAGDAEQQARCWFGAGARPGSRMYAFGDRKNPSEGRSNRCALKAQQYLGHPPAHPARVT